MSTTFPPTYTLGEPFVVTIPDPAAGAVASIAVPAGEMWRPRSVRCVLTPDATAITRFPAVSAKTAAGTEYAIALSSAALGAGAATLLGWALGSPPSVGAGGWHSAGLFDVLMLQFHTFEVRALNLQAGDTITGIQFHYERWYV